MSSQIKNLWWKKRRRWSYKEPRSYKRYIIPLVIVILLLPVLAFGAYVIAKQWRARLVEVSGATIKVKAGGDFQDALNRANPGDTILLEAGVTYNGSFTLPNKPGSQFITIRSSAPDTQLPKPNERMDPARYASVLPKIVSTTVEPVIKSETGSHHFRFIAVEIGPTKNGMYNIVALGTGDERKVEELPHHIEFDRVYIHGSPMEGQRRGIAANGKYIKVINSYISDIKRHGEESQAICAWATDGPLEIVNNYLEAAAENILIGGGGSYLNLVASDIIIRDNHLNKPVKWRAEEWVVKNLLELKSAQRVKIENNLLTNNWVMAQTGTAVLFTTSPDSGKYAIVKDVEYVGNIVRSAGGALGILGRTPDGTKGGHNLVIRNNIFEDISYEKYGGHGLFIGSSDWEGLIVENNTVINDGKITMAYGIPVKGLVFRNNIVFHNESGFIGDGVGGQNTLDTYYPEAVVSNNAIIGGEVAKLKSKNIYPASINDLKFVNPSANDYRLKPDSPLKRAGYNNADIGANLDPKTVGFSR